MILNVPLAQRIAILISIMEQAVITALKDGDQIKIQCIAICVMLDCSLIKLQ
jgi:hypothetical protein